MVNESSLGSNIITTKHQVPKPLPRKICQIKINHIISNRIHHKCCTDKVLISSRVCSKISPDSLFILGVLSVNLKEITYEFHKTKLFLTSN